MRRHRAGGSLVKQDKGTEGPWDPSFPKPLSSSSPARTSLDLPLSLPSWSLHQSSRILTNPPEKEGEREVSLGPRPRRGWGRVVTGNRVVGEVTGTGLKNLRVLCCTVYPQLIRRDPGV